MALSFSAVQRAYEVMNELELKEIQSWPPDFRDIDQSEKENPVEDKTYGIDRKSDDGWENLFFFKKNPSQEFIDKWNELRRNVPNSSFSRLDKDTNGYYIFGWF